MPSILRKSLAPVSPDAWSEIEETATEIISAMLTGRKLVDLDGPHGWEKASVNTGRLKLAEKDIDGVGWGVREVLPLVEMRVPFELDLMELDTIARGSKDPDLGPLEEAAEKTAVFEEKTIYGGFKETGIKGLIDSSSHKPLKVPASCEEYPATVAEGIRQLSEAGVGGPYALALGSKAYHCLLGKSAGYPPYRVVRDMLKGGVHNSAPLEGGVLLSVRGGDFELTVGKDISIGYIAHDNNKVQLYFTETFTFRVLEPAAAIALKA